MQHRKEANSDSDPLLTFERTGIRQRESIYINIPTPVCEILGVKKGTDVEMHAFEDCVILRADK